MAASSLCILALIVSAFVIGQTAVTSQPEDVATMAGRDVKYNCSLDDNTPMTWTHTRPGSTVHTTIFLSLNKEVNNPEKHSITGKYDLTVKSAAPYDGGKYYCKVFYEPNIEMSANLYVFEPLSCGSHQMQAVEGDNVTMFCHSVYGGETEPRAQLTGTTSNMVTMVTKSSNSTSQYISMDTSLIVTSEDDGRQVVCHVSLDRPEYAENCTITLDVQYYPKNITIYPAWDYIYVGEYLKCNASGNPEPVISWENQNSTEETIPSDTLTVTSAMMGNNTWRCIATNSVNGTRNSTYLDFNFYVGSGMRTTMGPTSAAATPQSAIFAGLFMMLLAFSLHRRN